jgi:hypothetical protein
VCELGIELCNTLAVAAVPPALENTGYKEKLETDAKIMKAEWEAELNKCRTDYQGLEGYEILSSETSKAKDTAEGAADKTKGATEDKATIPMKKTT